MILIYRSTLRIPGLIKFGPLDEKEATMGALESKAVSVLCIVPTGWLQNRTQKALFSMSNATESCCLRCGNRA